jgi:hypothetical protein
MNVHLVLATRRGDDPVDLPLSLKCHTSAYVQSTSPVPPVEGRSVASVRSRLVMVAAEERSGRRVTDAPRRGRRRELMHDHLGLGGREPLGDRVGVQSVGHDRARSQAAHQILLRALLVIPTTSWPRATSRETSALPRTPVVPATKTFATAPHVSFPI